MKRKVLVLFAMLALIFALVGCEESISGISNLPGVRESLSPSSWTIGTWDLEVGDTLISSLVFSSDNVVWTVNSTGTGLGFNFKEMSGTSGITFSDENFSSSVYKITMAQSGVTQTYTFIKTSNTTLTFSLSTNGYIQNLEGFEKR